MSNNITTTLRVDRTNYTIQDSRLNNSSLGLGTKDANNRPYAGVKGFYIKYYTAPTEVDDVGYLYLTKEPVNAEVIEDRQLDSVDTNFIIVEAN